MMQQTVTPGKRNLLGIMVAISWLIASGILLTTQMTGQTNLSGAGQIAGLVFIFALMLYLIRGSPHAADFPVSSPLLLPNLGFGATLLFILMVLILLFFLGIMFHPWLVMVVALTSIAFWVIIRHRKHLSSQLVLIGLAAGGLCLLLSGLSSRLDVFQGIYLACIPVLFIGGKLLTQHTGLSHVYSAEGRWGLALKGFVWACVLALPFAILNISSGAHAEDAWINQIWEPLVAFVPGIAEETWARLFMVTLIYDLLRPKSKQDSSRAVVTAVLVAAFVHSLAHLPGRTVFSPAALQMLITGLLFGVPMGLLFVKRDFEHAVGFHFFIDFVRFLVALG